MIERLPWPLRPLLDWQRRRFFREEDWRIDGSGDEARFRATVETITDRGRPLLMTLPKFGFNRAFVGRIDGGRIVLKHRTRPLIWPIGPGSYYFSGIVEEGPGGHLTVAGRYLLRPTLAIMYYAYLSLGFGFLAISLLAMLGGTGAWAITEAGDTAILLSGSKMLVVSIGYISLGWLHISLEKWLDGRNRIAVRDLLERAASGADPAQIEAGGV